MTTENPNAPADAGPSANPGGETDVDRARAELVAALTELEDKVNIPKRMRRLRQEAPGKFFATVGTAGTVAAGLVALGVLAVIRRR